MGLGASPTLEAAIELALEAVQTVPGLSVATFCAPAQPNGMPPDEDDNMPTPGPAAQQAHRQVGVTAESA